MAVMTVLAVVWVLGMELFSSKTKKLGLVFLLMFHVFKTFITGFRSNLYKGTVHSVQCTCSYRTELVCPAIWGLGGYMFLHKICTVSIWFCTYTYLKCRSYHPS